VRNQTLIGLTLLVIFAAATTLAQSAGDPRPRIDRVDPAEPIVGQSFDIYGDHFGDQQRRWVVYLYQPTRHRDSLTHDLRILEWTNRRVRARLPDAIPASSELPTGTRYVLHIVVPGRLLSSNHLSLFIGNSSRPPNVSRAGQPWIRRIYADTARAELWIYGRSFAVLGRLVNERGVPEGVDVLISGPGLTNRRTTQISNWHDDRVIVWPITRACDPGTYNVQIRTNTDPTHWSNEMSVTLDRAFCRLASRHAGFMHIDGLEVEEWPFTGADVPVQPRPGDLLDIFGKYFDSERGSGLDVLQGSRVVELVRAVHGRAHATEAPVFDVRGRPDRRIGLQWSEDHICVKIPSDLEPDDYLLRILDKSARRSSNTVQLRIVARVIPAPRL
jgi:hypothetical protein